MLQTPKLVQKLPSTIGTSLPKFPLNLLISPFCIVTCTVLQTCSHSGGGIRVHIFCPDSWACHEGRCTMSIYVYETKFCVGYKPWWCVQVFSRTLICIRFYRKYQENNKASFSDASWKSLENNVFQWFSSRYIRHGDLVSCDQSQANKRYTGTLNFIHSWWIWDFSYIFHADWLMRVLYHQLQFKLSLRREWDQ